LPGLGVGAHRLFSLRLFRPDPEGFPLLLPVFEQEPEGKSGLRGRFERPVREVAFDGVHEPGVGVLLDESG